MNKRILLSIVLLLLVRVASSQILIALVFGDKLNNERLEFGLNVGLNASTISNVEQASYMAGLNLGMTFVYKINDRFHLNPALYFSYPLGAKGMTVYETPDSNLNELLREARLKRELSYFSLPITIRYRVFGKTFLEFGPQISLNTNAQDIFEVSMFNDDEVVYTRDLKDEYKRFDFGLTCGITQKLREQSGVHLTFRYYYGLLDISKNDDFPDQHSSSFYFSAGIPIGGNKKSKTNDTVITD